MTEVVERFEDGRFVVVVEGVERFRLVRQTEGRSFRTGEVERVDDGEDVADDELRAAALKLFEELRDAVGADVESPEVDDPELSFAIARRVEIDARTKQLLLESRSEPERLEQSWGTCATPRRSSSWSGSTQRSRGATGTCAAASLPRGRRGRPRVARWRVFRRRATGTAPRRARSRELAARGGDVAAARRGGRSPARRRGEASARTRRSRAASSP